MDNKHSFTFVYSAQIYELSFFSLLVDDAVDGVIVVVVVVGVEWIICHVVRLSCGPHHKLLTKTKCCFLLVGHFCCECVLAVERCGAEITLHSIRRLFSSWIEIKVFRSNGYIVYEL